MKKIDVECETCNGTGTYEVDCWKCHCLSGRHGVAMRVCTVCDGYGYTVETCPDCGGSGEVTATIKED